MSSYSNQELASLVIKFLKDSLSTNAIPEDNRESIDFAVESIADAFSVDAEKVDSTIDTKFKGKSLSQLLSSLSTVESSAPSKSSSSSTEVEVPVHVDSDDAEKKESAEALKLEGNRAMAKRDFDTAIAKYTEAIALLPGNAVYLSNRAAAYSSVRKHELALADAEKAVEVEPSYAKAWSRMGLAKYALGDAEGAMKAYEKGLEMEGDKASDAMKKGFETAKQRVADNLASGLGDSSNSVTPTASASASSTRGAGASASASAGAGGLPDLSSLAGMFGGGGAGAGGAAGGLAGLMNNPQVMQAAQQFMQNPEALNGLMNNPQLRQMAQNFGLGGGAGAGAGSEGDSSSGSSGPNFDDLMNNPMLQNLANQFLGGNSNNNNQ